MGRKRSRPVLAPGVARLLMLFAGTAYGPAPARATVVPVRTGEGRTIGALTLSVLAQQGRSRR